MNTYSVTKTNGRTSLVQAVDAIGARISALRGEAQGVKCTRTVLVKQG